MNESIELNGAHPHVELIAECEQHYRALNPISDLSWDDFGVYALKTMPAYQVSTTSKTEKEIDLLLHFFIVYHVKQ